MTEVSGIDVNRADRAGRRPAQGALLAAPAPAEHIVDGEGVASPVARVLLDSPLPHLDRLFDYLVPPDLDGAAAVGTSVAVRFGGQDMRGWVWERGTTTTHPGRLASLRGVVSDLSLLTGATMALTEAVATRSAGVRSDVVRLAVPPRHASTESAERDRLASPPRQWRPPSAGGWDAYHGAGFLDALAGGETPRAVWTALPGRAGLVREWTSLLADAVRAALASGRGALVVVATATHAETVATALKNELNRASAREPEDVRDEPIVVLTAEGGPARRYQAFLQVLLGFARVVVGTRAAAFAPVRDLGLAVVWDDGDNRLDERHAPYTHARTVLALRSGLEGAGLLVAGHSRSVEAQGYVERGWAEELTAVRSLRRAAVARVQAPGAPEMGAEGASGMARIPSLAHRAVRDALVHGPVLVQVTRAGYAPVVACRRCGRVPRCPHCGGPLSMERAREITCRWCAREPAGWTCPACGGDQVRMRGSGSTRTGEELGRAFPGTPVVVSGARESHGVIESVDASPRLVVATPGAEPVADGGYRAVLLLDGALLSARPELGAGAEALRRWTNAVVLARADARVILLGDPDPSVVQALVRWDHAGYAREDLHERADLHLPPAWRTARLDGRRSGVEALLAQAESEGFETLGPAPVEVGRAAPSAPGDGAIVRALIRAPVDRGRELAAVLRVGQRERSAHREEPVRVELDPTVLW